MTNLHWGPPDVHRDAPGYSPGPHGPAGRGGMDPARAQL